MKGGTAIDGLSASAREGDRWFESSSLQRRVCEPLFRALGVLGLSGDR
jgi:hypothetical protein